MSGEQRPLAEDPDLYAYLTAVRDLRAELNARAFPYHARRQPVCSSCRDTGRIPSKFGFTMRCTHCDVYNFTHTPLHWYKGDSPSERLEAAAKKILSTQP